MQLCCIRAQTTLSHFADGGLTDNGKTATFTALKIYREGSEFGQVRNKQTNKQTNTRMQ